MVCHCNQWSLEGTGLEDTSGATNVLDSIEGLVPLFPLVGNCVREQIDLLESRYRTEPLVVFRTSDGTLLEVT